MSNATEPTTRSGAGEVASDTIKSGIRTKKILIIKEAGKGEETGNLVQDGKFTSIIGKVLARTT